MRARAVLVKARHATPWAALVSVSSKIGHPIPDGELNRVSRRVRRLDPLPEGFLREILAFLVPVRFQIVEQ